MSLTELSRRTKGIRFRLTLIYSLSFTIFVCLFAVVMSKMYFRIAREDFDSALLNYAIYLAAQVEVDKTDYKTARKRDNKKRFPFLEESTYYHIRSPNGEFIEKGHQTEKHFEIPYDQTLGKENRYTHRFISLRVGHLHFRAINLKIVNSQNKELILQVATPSILLDEQQKEITLINFILIPILILISSLVAYLMAGKVLAPIKIVSAMVNNIAAKNLSLRLPEFNTGDEFQELSVTFNDLLDRLQKAFEAQEHFVANASHQLYTPLTIIKGELDVLENKARGLEEHQKFNRSLREEVERMIELVKNLLLISRIEAGKEDAFRLRPMRLDDAIMNTITRMKPRARDKRITVRFNISDDMSPDDLIIAGERQLISSMFENLLDNAIKYSPEDSSVGISISKNGHLKVSIEDNGPGIRPTELKNILEKRFRRGAMTLMPGTGIGLSIANKIAEHHKASISYEKLQPQGSLFVVHFAKQIL